MHRSVTNHFVAPIRPPDQHAVEPFKATIRESGHGVSSVPLGVGTMLVPEGEETERARCVEHWKNVSVDVVKPVKNPCAELTEPTLVQAHVCYAARESAFNKRDRGGKEHAFLNRKTSQVVAVAETVAVPNRGRLGEEVIGAASEDVGRRRPNAVAGHGGDVVDAQAVQGLEDVLAPKVLRGKAEKHDITFLAPNEQFVAELPQPFVNVEFPRDTRPLARRQIEREH